METNENFEARVSVMAVKNVEERIKSTSLFKNRMVVLMDEKYDFLLDYCVRMIDRSLKKQSATITYIKCEGPNVTIIADHVYIVCLSFDLGSPNALLGLTDSLLSICSFLRKVTMLRSCYKSEGQCRSVARTKTGFVLCVYIQSNFDVPAQQVHYVEQYGSIKEKLVYDDEGNALFSDPVDIAVSSCKGYVFVSDRGNHSVVVLGGGEGDGPISVYAVFKSETMVSPRGLCVDASSNVYVACQGNVIQIQRGWVDSRVLYSQTVPGSQNSVSFVTFCQTTNTLEVVEEGSKDISKFEFLGVRKSHVVVLRLPHLDLITNLLISLLASLLYIALIVLVRKARGR